MGHGRPQLSLLFLQFGQPESFCEAVGVHESLRREVEVFLRVDLFGDPD
jgi:hypothetical protein